MELVEMWQYLGVILVAIACWTNAAPIDMTEGMDAAKMTAMGAMNMAMDAAENMKVGGFSEVDMNMGPMDMKMKQGVGAGMGQAERRRRSIKNSVWAVETQTDVKPRIRRSPCYRMSGRYNTTPAPNAGGAGAGGAAGENVPGTTAIPNADDIPRRRKRSVNENEIDENMDIIPAEVSGDKAENLREKVHKMVKTMMETMRDVFDGIASAFRTPESQ